MQADEAEQPQGMGAFRILRRLPASSREVFLARDAEGKNVVLKVFGAPQRNQGLLDPKIADEASAYARLSHPNIVKVVDMFSQDGQFVIALEYVDGTTLGVMRATLDRAGQAVPDDCWLYVMHCVFAALAEAHAAKDVEGKAAPVIHRGVNPSNVLIGWDGTVKLGNFNVAQSVRVLRDSNPGLTWGSYGYFAPEQVRLEPPTPRSDVYSATLLLWELLAGRKGIERASMADADLLMAMASPKLTPLEQLRRDVAAPVRYAVRAGLEPDPKRRIVEAPRIRDVLRAAIHIGETRTKLVALLANVRTLTASVPPASPVPAESPPPGRPAASAPPAPPPQVIEIISLLPDPVSNPPPMPVVPRAPPAPVIEAPPTPAAPPMPAPFPSPPPMATPVGVAMEALHEPIAPMPALPPSARTGRRRTALAIMLAVLGVAACILVSTVALRKLHARKPIAAAVTPEPHVPLTPTATATVTVTVTVTATATPTVTATATAAATETRGQLVPPPSAAGHRIFVDNHVVGDGTKPIDLACGHHTLRVGSHGKTQPIDVPCGGTFTAD